MLALNWERFADRAGPFAIFGGALLVLLGIRHVIFRWAEARARSTLYGGAAVEALRFPAFLWALAGSLWFSLRYADLTDRQVQLSENLIRVFVVVSLYLMAAALAVRLVTLYGERRHLPFAVAGLSRTLTYIFVLSIGAMSLLSELGIRITPLLTALGVGGLAVALALQDTLANFFAGIHILIEAPMNLGDYVKLSSSEEGTVTDIGWRTTRLKTPAGAIVVVPNTKITSGILTNFSPPETRTPTDVAILVGLSADLEQVQRLALEEAARTEGVLPDSMVFFCDPGMLPTHIQAKVAFAVGNRFKAGPVQSAVRMKILSRLRAEGVPFPEPLQTTVVRNG